ncbi:helix-turn-helix transcriptional regulator [Desulfopila aestuarii]|uniref:WYL domain-containing protein n=1 Tax=Desulfopila aestuarii DSM 18488 TaxID=1121416 RepID=A0A1M7YI63_9BACT|nr:WYL domain-containing protein [Desulfopila aestuarii]SHO52317.1 WYL domain-containing protein [Desulfopila aestuarii DSM 18488]
MRGEIRTFSLSRISKAKTTGKSFAIPEHFSFKKLSGSHFGVHWTGGEIGVKILFKRNVADYVRERTWHPSQELVDCDNGDVILSLTVNHLLELKRWILSWGAEAEVLEPESFAKEIHTTLATAADLYR